jgi:hypothetical protein
MFVTNKECPLTSNLRGLRLEGCQDLVEHLDAHSLAATLLDKIRLEW